MSYLERIIRRNFYSAVFFTWLLSFSQFALPQTAATFDLNRFSTVGKGVFETFHVEETRSLQAVLDAKIVSPDMQLMVTHTASGNLALVRDQMAFHHIAQGTADGVPWMATF